MKNICRRMFIVVSVLALLAIVPSMLAETENQLIANLSSSDERTVVLAMAQLKHQYPHSTNAIRAVKKLMGDSRPKVRQRAVGWLGVTHAKVSEQDVKAICALLKESDERSNAEALGALRGVQGPAVAGTVPEVLPFLKSSNTHLVRDACRTLAMIGNKDIIPKIEPLLNNSERAVRKDAQAAITALRSKP